MLEAKFFKSFWVLHFLGKQVYKLELPKQWMIYNVFYILLLEKDNTKKKRVDKTVTKLEFEAGYSKEYEMEVIWDSAIYANKAKDYLLSLYYLVAWKKYLEEENTWKLLSAVQHLKKLINAFHKEHLKNQEQIFNLLIPLYQWLGQLSS